MIRRITVACLLMAASAPLAAQQTYKWVDERGVTNYGEKPPAGRQAQPVDTQPGGTLESANLPRQKKPETGATQPGREQAAGAAPPQAAPVRGMDFDTYIRLQTGMTEGELILRAGKPDHESVENARRDVVKSFYYYPTAANPFVTVVTLRGGRIANIERTRKTF
ncbi:MAG: DUF4124 domain-containing protein [Burkholderiales bacterium]|nr:DUF4124 domain-containing protein [Burkholderiales bacterium]